MAYVKRRSARTKFGGESVTYEGVGATKKWDDRVKAEISENIVAGIRWDILCYAMRTLLLLHLRLSHQELTLKPAWV
jgi:DNA polymerase